MKKIITLLMAMAIMSIANTAAMAADETVTGFYDIGTKENVVITPYAGDTQVSVSDKNIDDDADAEKVYVDSNKLGVAYNAATANEHYGIILVDGTGLPTKDTEIYYINQETAAGATVSFNAGIKAPQATTDMTLYISSSKAGASLLSIPMSYAVDAAVAGGEIDRMPGDVTGDSEVTVKDVITLRRFIAGSYNVTVNEAAADVTGDGEITVKDVITLRRYIAGSYNVELK